MKRYPVVDLSERPHPSPGAYENLLSELRAEIARQRLSQRALALAMGAGNQQWLSRRLLGVTPFTVPELIQLAGLLGVGLPELASRAAPRPVGSGGQPATFTGRGISGFPRSRDPLPPGDRHPSPATQAHAA